MVQVEGSPVDPEWYLLAHPDVAAAGRDPVRHWRRHGLAEGRAPSPAFDPDAYLAAHPDVAAGLPAVTHWWRFGRAEGRQVFPRTSGPGEALAAPELGRLLAGEPAGRQRALLLYHHPRLLPWGTALDSLAQALAALVEGRLETLPHEAGPAADPVARVVVGPGDEQARLLTRIGVLADPASAGFVLDGAGPAGLPVVRLPAGAWPAPGAVGRLAEDVRTLGRDPEAEVEAVDLARLGDVRPPTARRDPDVAAVVRILGSPTAAARRALVADVRIPTPDRDSGSLSTMQYVRALRRLGHAVDLVTLHDVPFEAHRRAIEREGVSVRSDLAAAYDVALVMRAEPFASLAPRLRELDVGRLVYVAVDLHHRRLAGQAQVEGGDAGERDALAVEVANVAAADLTLVNSTSELDHLRALCPDASVAHVPMARSVVPAREPDDDRDDEIVFLGGFLHRPNLDAVHWFLDEVWPRVSAALPQARFVVCGADLPASLAARSGRGVEMRGHVPTVADAFARARLSVVPLRYGAGVKGKLVSALMHGIPVVSTPVGVEGLDLRAGAVTVADGAEELAASIVALHEDPARRAAQRRAAYAVARDRFTLDALVERLRDVLER